MRSRATVTELLASTDQPVIHQPIADDDIDSPSTDGRAIGINRAVRRELKEIVAQPVAGKRRNFNRLG